MRKELLIGLLLTAMSAGAVKMKPGVATIKQSDGTTLTVRAYGDEDLSYFVATDGTLLYQVGTDFYIADVAANGTLVPTKILAHDPLMRSAQEKKMASMQNKQLFYNNIGLQAKANKIRREPMAENSTLLPHLGKQKIPVILVEFNDVAFTINNPKETFNKYLNGKDLFNKTNDPEMGYFTASGSFVGNYGSVARYFNDMSFGKFQPEFDVYGPVKLNNNLAYYGAGYSSQENMTGLLSDACTAADDEVDFKQYDSNNDGNVDLVYIIYAGFSQSIAGNSTDCIHPKSGTLSIDKTFDGLNVVRYGVNNELNGTLADQANGALINGIGLFCHEFSHCMGLPDLYPTSGSMAEKMINQNMDYWSLMDAGEYTYNGYRPTEYTAWERERLEWMDIETLSEPADVELNTLANNGKAYRIINDNDKSGHEYYIVENVQKKGWNKSLFGSGMMITHVDYDDYMFSLGGCKVNSTPAHPRMTLMAADGMLIPEYYIGETITESSDETLKGHNAAFVAKYNGTIFDNKAYKAEAAGDLYPGTSNKTELTDTSSPMNAWIYTGGTMNKPITDIAMDTETGIVSFKFMGGKTDGIENITNKDSKDSRIFSISGVYMGNEMSILPNGLYIKEGKKIIKN